MGVFTSRLHQPTKEQVASMLGSEYRLWKRLVQFVENKDHIEGKWSFWGPEKSGWNMRFRRKGKALVPLYPGHEQIIANIVLDVEQAQEANGLKLGEKASKLLRKSPQLHDGRWLFIPVVNEADADEIEQLLLLKLGQSPDSRKTDSI